MQMSFVTDLLVGPLLRGFGVAIALPAKMVVRETGRVNRTGVGCKSRHLRVTRDSCPGPPDQIQT